MHPRKLNLGGDLRRIGAEKEAPFELFSWVGGQSVFLLANGACSMDFAFVVVKSLSYGLTVISPCRVYGSERCQCG